MIFTTPTEYAIRGLSELASRPHGRSVLLDDIVPGTGLPRDFLGKIFQKLVKTGILKSAKGRGGGFSLARPSHEITLRHIIEALEGPQLLDRCVVGLEKCNDQMPCAQHDLYKPIRQRLNAYLDTTSLADLAASLKAKMAWRKVHSETGEPTPEATEPTPAAHAEHAHAPAHPHPHATASERS